MDETAKFISHLSWAVAFCVRKTTFSISENKIVIANFSLFGSHVSSIHTKEKLQKFPCYFDKRKICQIRRHWRQEAEAEASRLPKITHNNWRHRRLDCTWAQFWEVFPAPKKEVTASRNLSSACSAVCCTSFRVLSATSPTESFTPLAAWVAPSFTFCCPSL